MICSSFSSFNRWDLIILLTIAIHIFAGIYTVQAERIIGNFAPAQIVLAVSHAVSAVSVINYIIYYKYLLSHPKQRGYALQAVVFNLEAITGYVCVQALIDLILFAENPAHSLFDSLGSFLVVANYGLVRYHLGRVFQQWWDAVEPATSVSRRAHTFRVLSSDLIPLNFILYLLFFIPLNFVLYRRHTKEEEEEGELGVKDGLKD